MLVEEISHAATAAPLRSLAGFGIDACLTETCLQEGSYKAGTLHKTCMPLIEVPMVPIYPVLGGPWDLGTIKNWAYNPTHNALKWAYRGYPNYK